MSNKYMNPQEFAERMLEIAKIPDIESAHSEADDLMCDLLRSLGYGPGIEIFAKMDKWYA